MELKRRLNLTKLTFYGVGDILGAGIYILVGKVVAEAGGLAWAAFLFAILAALPTALSYAELSSRYPKSGGAAVFVGRAFKNSYMPFVVGFLVLLSCLVSTATVANAFHGYFSVFLPLPRWLIIIAFLFMISVVNFLGIEESSRFNILCVTAEIGGLLLIIFLGWKYWGSVPLLEGIGGDLTSKESLKGIGAASVLAFYATIGFEDICNVSEEVKKPEKNVPRAILLALSISAILYVGVALTVVSVASIEEMGSSKAPLAMVASKLSSFFSPKILAFLALMSVVNTALANLITASRLMYGMSKEGWLFKALMHVHPKRQTPALAILFSFVLAAILALSGTLVGLGQTTSLILLTVFILVHVSLLRIRHQKLQAEGAKKFFRVPIFVPIIGIAISLFLMSQAPWSAYWQMFIIFGVGFLLYVLSSGILWGKRKKYS